MANIKIRNLPAAGASEVYSGNFLAGALSTDGGYGKATRSFTFDQIVSGGSGVLGGPGSPFVFNDTTNAAGYFDSLYITGVSPTSLGPWHQVTTDWSGASPATLAQVSQLQTWNTDYGTPLEDIYAGLTSYITAKTLELSEDWDLTVTGLLLATSGNFTESLTISGNSVLTGAAGGGGGASPWVQSASDIYFNGGNVGIGTIAPAAPLEVSSTAGGLIMPRMTTAQMNAISAPSNGEMIYNTSSGKFAGYEAGAWQPLESSARGKYVADWATSHGGVPVAAGATMTITHNLGTRDICVSAYVNASASDVGADGLEAVIDADAALTYGVFITSIIDANSFVLQLGDAGYVACDSNGSATATLWSAKFIKVVVIS